jgi:hypothetical protein
VFIADKPMSQIKHFPKSLRIHLKVEVDPMQDQPQTQDSFFDLIRQLLWPLLNTKSQSPHALPWRLWLRFRNSMPYGQ